MRGIVFDFNGTLFWDTAKHDAAWTALARELIGRDLTAQELKTDVQGRTTPDIIKFILGSDVAQDTIKQLSKQKESLYRELCWEDREGLKLAPGASQFLDRLKRENVPCAVATSSGSEDVDFYFQAFELEKWFSRDYVIYNDGTIAGKPAPDLFLRSFAKLGLSPRDCVVVEDSPAGIEAALNAEAKEIVFMVGDSLWSGDVNALHKSITGCSDFFEMDTLYF